MIYSCSFFVFKQNELYLRNPVTDKTVTLSENYSPTSARLSDGNPLRAGNKGNSTKIMVNGVEKLPSELDVTDKKQRNALLKVAVFLSTKNGAPKGSRIGTGTTSQDVSNNIPAFTMSTPPYLTLLNFHGGSFSKDLDNIYSFTNIIDHEIGHQKNYKSNPAHRRVSYEKLRKCLMTLRNFFKFL